MRCRFAVIALLFLASCAGPREHPGVQSHLAALLPADALLVGEQHDAPQHQRMAHELVDTLASRGHLAALALEMAEAGTSTAHLPRRADEAGVQAALRWNDAAWPWLAYGPVVMAAVRAGVPVLGANLPRERMREAMADARLDARLPAAALAIQQQAIRDGHCDLLPPAQIAPMTRIQIARDIRMAHALERAQLPGKTVVLLAGGGHVLRDRGAPVHLSTGLKAKVLLLQAGHAGDDAAQADLVVRTPALPPRDYCTGLRQQFAPRQSQ